MSINMKVIIGSRSGGSAPPGDIIREPSIEKESGLEIPPPLSAFEMNAELLSSNKSFSHGPCVKPSLDPRHRDANFVYTDDKSWIDNRRIVSGDHWGSSRNDDTTATWSRVWDNYSNSYENKPYYETYPKFEHKGKVFIWQAKAYEDGHLFLASVRKYCLDHYHKDSRCLRILLTGARTILNIYQGYFRSLGSCHKYCKLKFLKHFVSHFDHNMQLYRKACKKNGRFEPHGTFREALEAARNEDTWSASLVSFFANWDTTKDFIRDGVTNYASSLVTEYADRCSILADILSAANRLFQTLISFKNGHSRIDEIIMSINSFYRSLDFSNVWAKKLKRSLASIFPSYDGICDSASRLRELINYLIDGCSPKFKRMFDSVTTLINDFGTLVTGRAEENRLAIVDVNGGFFPHGPLQQVIDICDSDLGFMAAKLTALVASFCALVTADGVVPELSYKGLSEFSVKHVFPIMMATIVAGKMTTYLVDFDKVLSLMWQFIDSIFKGDFGRFVGVDSYSQIFELYSFVATSYGGIPPTQDTLKFSGRDHFRCPVSMMLPCSIVNSSDPDWSCMIEDLEGTLPGSVSLPKKWSDGMKIVAKALNSKLEHMVQKVTLTKEMKTKFTNITTHLQALTRNVSTLPSPNKASGVSFIFTGAAGIGKSKSLGDTFIKTVTGLIHHKAWEYGYPDIGNWQPGDVVDHRCIDKSRRGNYMVNRLGGVPFLYSHVEDFDPCIIGPVPPENNIVHRIMMTGDAVSANTEAAALESKKGDGVKGDNHFRILAGFYSDNRHDAGVNDISVCVPAVVRRSVFVEWHLKQKYSDMSAKLDLTNKVVKSARNVSDSSSLYNTVTVYTFLRLSTATGDFAPGEAMVKVPVEYVFTKDQTYGSGNEIASYRKGETIVLSKVSINTFYCYIHDFVNDKYDKSFRAWRASEIKSSLKSEAGRCKCPNNLTIRHCPVCAGIHEFNSFTGNLAIMCPRIRDPDVRDMNPSRYASFEERSILTSLRFVDQSMIELFPILVQSATLRPVTIKIFDRLPLSQLIKAHSAGDKWLFAENGGSFIESGSLDYLLGISAGVIYRSAQCLEDWWSSQFSFSHTLAEVYFFLLRYIIFTPSKFSPEQSENNANRIDGLRNSTLKMLWQSSLASGVDSNGISLKNRIKRPNDRIRANDPSDVDDINGAKATFVSITKCLIFDALLADPKEIGDSHFEFVKSDFVDATRGLFSDFGISAREYFHDFLSSFVPPVGSSILENHEPIMASSRRNLTWKYEDMISWIFVQTWESDNFWGFASLYDPQLGDPGIRAGPMTDKSDMRSAMAAWVTTSVISPVAGYRPYGATECVGEEEKVAEPDLGTDIDDYLPDIAHLYTQVSDAFVRANDDCEETGKPLGCCKGVEVRLPDGTVEIYHHPKCQSCGFWCDKVLMHLNREPSSLNDRSDFVEIVRDPARLNEWEELSKSAFSGRRISNDDEWWDMSCPGWCSSKLWDSNPSYVIPLLSPSSSKVATSIHKFSEFLKDFRDVVRRSCFIHIPKITTKAILYTLAPIVAAGAFYPIFYRVLTTGDEDDEGFEPHGVHSNIPDGENYWSETSLVKQFSAKEVHNPKNTHSACHGRTVKDLASGIFGHNKNCNLNRIVKLTRRDVEKNGFESRIHAFCYDSNAIIVPSHYFSDLDLDKGVSVNMHLTLNGKTGGPPITSVYEFTVTSRNVYFDSKLDCCMVAHGLSGLHLNPLDVHYQSDFYCAVNVDGTYWYPESSGLVSCNDKFFNCSDLISFFGRDSVTYPDCKGIMPHLKSKPMDGLLAREVKSSDYKRKNGECGLPVIFSDKTRFPVLGFYIGNYNLVQNGFDDHHYECYVPLTKRFMSDAKAALFRLTMPGVTKATTIGTFSKLKGRKSGFEAKMDQVSAYDLDDPIVSELLQEAKRTSASNIRRTNQHVKWADFLSGSHDGHNVAEDTDIFRFSCSKSGKNVSLPTFETAKIKGIYAHHEGVRGIFPVIGSPNDVYFYPDFLYLGATPWMDDGPPHETFSGELPVGMVGPGVKSDGGSTSSMSLDQEVAKCMIHGNIDHELIHDAASRVYTHYFEVIQDIFEHDENGLVHDDVKRLLNTTIEEQFVGLKRDDGSVIMKKMDHTSSWGSNNKPPVGSGKRDVYEIGDNDELLIHDAAIPAWEAFTAAVYCFTCGVVPENQITTCFTKRECYPVTVPCDSHKYPTASNAMEFYSSLIGEDKAKRLLECVPGEDQKVRDIFHSVPDFKVKIKSRMVSNLPGSVNVAFRMFLLPLAYLFSNNPIEFDMVAGLDMGSCHLEQSTNQIFFDGYDEETDQFFVFDADVSAWDKIMPANLTKYTLTICIELVLVIHEYFGTYTKRHRAYADALLEWWESMSLFYGSVVMPISVMPSGFIFTLPLNSLMNQVLKVCNILKFSKMNQIPFPDDYTEWIRHKALGDDSQTAIKPAFAKACREKGIDVYSSIDYAMIMREFGITSTMGDKSDTSLAFQEPNKLVFLQHIMFYLEIPAYTLDEIEEKPLRASDYILIAAAPLKAPVLVKLLAKQDSSSSVEEKYLLRDQVYTVLGELVPYGKVRWQRFVNAVRDYSDPIWKPEHMDLEYLEFFDWNFWLDRYVKKFCRNGALDKHIIDQRSSNPKAFESLKRQLNPNGIERLSYDLK